MDTKLADVTLHIDEDTSHAVFVNEVVVSIDHAAFRSRLFSA